MAKTGVILLNLGGPGSLSAVRSFLYNLFSDRQIIRLGPAFMQKPLAWLISTLRAPKTRRAYSQMGGGSPIAEITAAQAEALGEALRPHGDISVYVAMRYWHPFSEDAVARLVQEGATRALSLPLYPQYSMATTGSSEARLCEVLSEYDVEYQSVHHWFDHPGYIAALSASVKRGMREGDYVLFSAHSLPVSFIEAGDPYLEHVEATVESVVRRLGLSKWGLAFQSRSGPVKWLEPSLADSIKRLAAEGEKDVLVVPVSFVSDHIETLYEIDILYKEMGEDLGLGLRRAESLNTDPAFIDALKDIVLGKLKESGWA